MVWIYHIMCCIDIVMFVLLADSAVYLPRPDVSILFNFD